MSSPVNKYLTLADKFLTYIYALMWQFYLKESFFQIPILTLNMTPSAFPAPNLECPLKHTLILSLALKKVELRILLYTIRVVA